MFGLLGLASFTAEQRTKRDWNTEGDGRYGVFVSSLLSKEFMILVGIAFVAASGLAWYAMDDWLSSFAYRIPIGASAFLIGGYWRGLLRG